MTGSTNNFLIITSIFPPTEAVKKFAEVPGWKVVVVGDKKSPEDWSHPNVSFLSAENQLEFGFEVTQHLPWNHYCRKIVGYLYAIKNGADIIADSDDDNIPYTGWPDLPTTWKADKTLSEVSHVNIYKYFTDEVIWPRGYPLDKIMSDSSPQETEGSEKVGIWQFLADEDPDVDAIYRLTINKPVYFKKGPSIALAKGTICPFNSQNTVFTKELFPLLYLPAFVTFRFTDILRGLVAQPIAWEKGYQLGFGNATVIQERNPHNYMRDFESEIPVYTVGEEATNIAIEVAAKNKAMPVTDMIISIYDALQVKGITTEEENTLINAWVNDLKKLGCA
jgi:hypothetical protein